MKPLKVLSSFVLAAAIAAPLSKQPVEGAEPGKGDTVIIHNESGNYKDTQSTGAFSMKQASENMTKHESLSQEAYKMDLHLDFEPSKKEAPQFNKQSMKSKAYAVGDKQNFWVIDASTYSTGDYQLNAELKHIGQRGEIWVHNNEISAAQAKEISDEFDQEIYPLVTDHFAGESDVDRNGKVSILIYDIKDGFAGFGGYIGGYFYNRDLYASTYSNNQEIFYIDTYPSMGWVKGSYDVSKAFSTIAHEFQHMVNYNQNVLVEKGPEMEDWMNEALSMAAEHMYKGPLKSRVNYYEASESIANGHSLLNWGQNGDVLSNYSLSYLFGQYLRIQAGQGDDIYKELLESEKSTSEALEDVIQTHIDQKKTTGQFLTDFRQALFVNDESGLYGFNGEPVLSKIVSPLYEGSLPHKLAGGGAISVPVGNAADFKVPSSKGKSIQYRVIDVTPPARPKVEGANRMSGSISGTAEAGSRITIKAGSSVLGEGQTSGDGTFTLSIDPQKTGTVLSVTAVDKAGNKSSSANLTISSKTDRIGGVDRYETAVKISKDGWKTADTVLLATGNDFPDALAGGPLAYQENAPILLTRSSSLHSKSEKEIDRLKAKKVMILGGTGVVSADVEAKLKQKGLSVERIGGKTRYETAANIAKKLTSQKAIIAGGSAFPDALAVSSYASRNGIPILLTRKNSVPKETEAAASGITESIVVGSTGVVSDETMEQFPNPTRYGGKTRYDTAFEISQHLKMGTTNAYAATGQDFPDVLAGSALAAKRDAGILLVKKHTIPEATKNLLARYEAFSIFGSAGVVGEEVKSELDKRIN
ncbi:cell wall-binding repeat-containing protein [Jeotgalibacillus sp. ET6]|uniref:cell wall-binding repeat-containing protein n=1 Tax=Jeotgalibacillus sp. ET6 TaxID=3037260 RepID=UPI0024185C9D|nr:cell wall-binding repeat-containing protein [Jeotgalibacillus sp. ET6]MDG5471540.1 cell wall-binding repeat-containing protein [Jeotgalibacillus sp. ET6]